MENKEKTRIQKRELHRTLGNSELARRL